MHHVMVSDMRCLRSMAFHGYYIIASPICLKATLRVVGHRGLPPKLCGRNAPS